MKRIGNVHNRREFFLFPVDQPHPIRCFFQAEMLEEVRFAASRTAWVSGRMTYRRPGLFPTEINVESIRTIHPSAELPTLASMKGTAPDCAAGVDSVSYIRKLRDEEPL